MDHKQQIEAIEPVDPWTAFQAAAAIYGAISEMQYRHASYRSMNVINEINRKLDEVLRNQQLILKAISDLKLTLLEYIDETQRREIKEKLKARFDLFMVICASLDNDFQIPTDQRTRLQSLIQETEVLLYELKEYNSAALPSLFLGIIQLEHMYRIYGTNGTIRKNYYQYLLLFLNTVVLEEMNQIQNQLTKILDSAPKKIKDEMTRLQRIMNRPNSSTNVQIGHSVIGGNIEEGFYFVNSLQRASQRDYNHHNVVELNKISDTYRKTNTQRTKFIQFRGFYFEPFIETLGKYVEVMNLEEKIYK